MSYNLLFVAELLAFNTRGFTERDMHLTFFWTIIKPTRTGWYWYRNVPAEEAMLVFCGAEWDHIPDFVGLNEPVTFTKDHLLAGEWAGPVELSL